MRRRISIRGCVRPYVRPSVRPWVRPWVRGSVSIKEKRGLGASYVGYPTLLIFIFGPKTKEIRSKTLEKGPKKADFGAFPYHLLKIRNVPPPNLL